MAVGIQNNNSFPALFEPGCLHGRNGDEFADNMLDHPTIAEATISMPRSTRAEMAISNPVAFVQEYKTLISDTLGVLLKVNIEHRGFYSKLESYSSRRTPHYRTKKGVFGHTFACPGVTEAHARGTLHWHFTIFAGLSPWLLQRFAHLQDICNEISAVLDTMYVSELPTDVQAAGLVTRYLTSKKVQWEIHSSITHSISHPEVLPSRKNPIAFLTARPCQSLVGTTSTSSPASSVAPSLPATEAFSVDSGCFSSCLASSCDSIQSPRCWRFHSSPGSLGTDASHSG